MNFKLNPGQSAYAQVAEYIHTQVALGKLKPGDRLPAIRTLAQETGLNPSTIAHAYGLLEREGTIVSHIGKGSFVTRATTSEKQDIPRRQRLDAIIERGIVEALGSGFSIEDIETAFTFHIAGWREQRSGKEKVGVKAHGKTINFQGSHDLAVELLARHLSTIPPGIRLSTTFNGSLTGLLALERGEADIAGAHLADEDTGDYNVPFIRRFMPNEVVTCITLVQRIQGLMVKRGNPKQIISIRDIARHDVSFINRQKGSGTRMLLDSLLRRNNLVPGKIKGYKREGNTHVTVASAILRNEADVGLGAQSAASAAGLDFIPMVKERYDLVVLKERAATAPLMMISEVVRSAIFRTMLGSIPGYDTSATGRVITVRPEEKKLATK